MKYILFGLGNPGEEYDFTRHNIGFDVLNALAGDEPWTNANFGWRCDVKHRGRQMILIKPNTSMNLSGAAVKFWVQKEKVELKNIVVVADELVLPLGSLRLKMSGSDAGHNGHKDIIKQLGTSAYPRLRFGIGNNFEPGRQVNFVLGKWSDLEKEQVSKLIDKSVETLKMFTFNGPSVAMHYANTTNA